METQCKLYEEEIKNLEKKCQEFETNINELRYDQAMESEHWQTIEAIFGKITDNMKNVAAANNDNDNDDDDNNNDNDDDDDDCNNRFHKLQLKTAKNLQEIHAKSKYKSIRNRKLLLIETKEIACNTDNNSAFKLENFPYQNNYIDNDNDKNIERTGQTISEHHENRNDLTNTNLNSPTRIKCAKCTIKDNQLEDLQKDMQRLLKEMLESEKRLVVCVSLQYSFQ